MDFTNSALPLKPALPPHFWRRGMIVLDLQPTEVSPRFHEGFPVALKREALVKYQEHSNDICEE